MIKVAIHFISLSVNVFSTKVLIGKLFLRDHNFTRSAETREVLAVCRTEVVPSFLSHSKTLSVDPSPEITQSTFRSTANRCPDWTNPALETEWEKIACLWAIHYMHVVVIFGVNVGLKNNTLAGKIKVLELSFGFLNPFSIFVVVLVLVFPSFSFCLVSFLSSFFVLKFFLLYYQLTEYFFMKSTLSDDDNNTNTALRKFEAQEQTTEKPYRFLVQG